jgi:2C-methyl-D-erythritol 2,4-cyclodiphosphate synthase
MRQEIYNDIISYLAIRESFEIHFTPGWKGYDINSYDVDSKLEDEISEWFYEEFIHSLIGDGLDSHEMIFKFSMETNELILNGTFISYGHDDYRDYLYKFSDLHGDAIAMAISDALGITTEAVDREKIEMRFDYSSKDSILKELSLFYQDKEVALSNQQLGNVNSFLLNIISKWNVGCGGMDILKNVFTEVCAEYKDLTVKTHGNASYKLSVDSACLI